jgi:hypothetical protein
VVTLEQPQQESAPAALIGSRPCELAAMRVLDRVFAGGEIPDPCYRDRREGSFVVVAECGTPAATCFCTSMGTGPGVEDGYDLALTELTSPDGPRYLVRVGSARGAEVIAEMAGRLRLPGCRARERSPSYRAQARRGQRPTAPGKQPGAPPVG